MILSCSPRLGGNSDDAAEIVLEAATTAGRPITPTVTYLREYTVFPCTGCNWCAASPGQCPLREKDDSKQLFEMLLNERELVLISPIYFYHLPAHLKALVDRSQTYWNMQRKVQHPVRPSRKAHVILIGGRKQGAELFKGSLLTCRYWLSLFGFEIAEPLVIYGVDERGDLMRNETLRQGVASYACAVYAGDQP
ncbi:MAG: hypothetical protein DELT_02709 [Desulfovibrio sp.]